MTAAPPVEVDAVEEYTVTERAFLVGVHLASTPNGMTTDEIARMVGLKWRSAWALMSRACGVQSVALSFIRYPGESAGRWVLVTNENIEALISGFEGRPPMK